MIKHSVLQIAKYFKLGDDEFVELKEFKNINKDDSVDNSETNIGGDVLLNQDEDEDIDDANETTKLLDNHTDCLDKAANNIRKLDKYNRIFGEIGYKIREIENFSDSGNNINIDLPSEYVNPKFIKYLMDKHNFQFIETTDLDETGTVYNIKYNGEPYTNENEVMQIPARDFYIKNLKFKTEDEFKQFRYDMKYLYDKWDNKDLKKRIKQAGLVGGIVLAIAGLVSGLSLGLKRTGHNMVHDSKMKWKKLTPAEKKQIVIPWTELEEASGKSAILIGDYLYVLIGGAILVYLIKK